MKPNQASTEWANRSDGNRPHRQNPASVVRRCFHCEEDDARRVACGLGALKTPPHHANEHYDTFTFHTTMQTEE